MKETYIFKRFNAKSLKLIAEIEAILSAYAAMGLDLTVRQLYYQLVTKNLIENSIRVYKQIVALTTDARLAGLLDWGSIVDRNRGVSRNSHWNGPGDILRGAALTFALDKWARQPKYVELMVEKDALSGVIEPVCEELDIPFTANKGYSSSSMMYRAGKRFRRRHDEGKELHIIYLGDHDPSGIDMTRDVQKRLEMFAGDSQEAGGPKSLPLNIHRVALNIDQVRKYNPPENPAKDTDTRSPRYVEEFGESCWELDALEPRVLSQIINKAVKKLRNQKLWDEAVKEEQQAKDELKRTADRFEDKEFKPNLIKALLDEGAFALDGSQRVEDAWRGRAEPSFTTLINERL
jgi:hypothetical protein